MLGLIFIYFLGKYFYELADHYDKSAWGFAILGIVVYYASTFICGILMVIVLELVSPGAIDNISDIQVSIMTIPLGLLVSWLFYQFLKRRFSSKSKKTVQTHSDLLDDEYL